MIVRLLVSLSALAKPLARLGLCRYEEWHEGQPLKILLVGYNGARNTGADARVVALTQQLEQALGADATELTVMTLDREATAGYFSERVRQLRFTTVFVFSLLRACSRHHAAILCEGSTLTPTFADALCVFFCEAGGIMRRQHKPCLAYGSEVGRLSGWLERLSRDLCRDTYFIVRTRESLDNLHALGLQGHQGTDTAWTFQPSAATAAWARKHLLEAGWDGRQPLLGVAVLNPFCWPVRPSVWRWLKAAATGDRSQQYDKLYFFSDSVGRRQRYQHYLTDVAAAVSSYSREHHAFVVILGMEKLDTKACRQLAELIDHPHVVCTSLSYDVFQMTALLRQLSLLLTSRYHAAVLSMEQACPIVAVSIDDRLNALMREVGLADNFLHQATDADLEQKLTASLQMAENRKTEVSEAISRHLIIYKEKVNQMSEFFAAWIKVRFS